MGKAMKRVGRLVALAGLVLGTIAGTTAQCQEVLVAEVRVEGAGYVSADVVLAAVRDIIRPGVEMTREKAAQAEQEIMRLGYYDRVAVSQRVRPDGRLDVIITVVEKQRIERVLFVGNTVITDDQLLAAIRSRPGGLVDRRLVERDAARIQETYARDGYFAQVSHADVDSFGVLTFVIEEARIEAVTITGLKRTKEHVVRRQINLKPGELFRDRRITENIHRIAELQIFQNVQSDVRPGTLDPNAVIVEFQIEEGRTGQASLALAYSNLDNLVMMVAVQETNFRGEAERATASLELFGRTSYDLGYVIPFLDARDTSLELNLFDTERRRRFVGGAAITTADDRFDERRSGGSVRLSRPLDEEKRRRVSLRFRSEEVSSSFFQGVRRLTPEGGVGMVGVAQSYPWDPGDARDPGTDNPHLYPDVAGPGDMVGPITIAAPLHPGGRLSSLTLGFSNDLRDSRLNPRLGSFTSFSGELAGSFLGGATDFTKLQAEYRRFFPVGDKHVLAFRLMGGTSFGDLPLFESYSVGGANTLRGYEEDRFRGENMMLGSMEYRHKLNESLSLVGFVDAGSAYGGSFPTVVPGFNVPADDQSLSPHVGVGVGMRVITPLGPIRLDFGWGEEGNQPHFSFGHVF